MKISYRKDIISVLILKFLALMLLWYCCFSKPVEAELNKPKLAQHYLGG